MNLRDARIGYAGYRADLGGPGDRRRFCAYATEKRLVYERADLSREYDLAYVTYSSDLPGWAARKRREGDKLKFVFEMVDSYFEQQGIGYRLLKGAARYALGIDSRLSPDFQRTLITACEAADAVICSTEEQRETIRRYNPNVFISFDFFADELGAPKLDYSRGEKLQIVWEGQSTTLSNIQAIREVLNDLRDRIELHVITDPIDYRYFGRFGARSSRDLLRGIETGIVFHPWARQSFSQLTKASDVVIIPIDMADRVARAKSASKLIMMWQLGMPVLTSATTAYARVMKDAGMDMACATKAEWGAQLERLIAAEAPTLESIGRECRTFAERAYSKEEFLGRFDQAFEAIGFSVPARRSR